VNSLFEEGDRVELKGPNALYHGCADGMVHAVYAGMEDTIEVLLDNGTYTCVDPRHLRSEE
jgi:hypothetical protein